MLEGQAIFAHGDVNQDGNLDELEFREPPFSELALFSLQQDGTYSPASKQRRDEVSSDNYKFPWRQLELTPGDHGD